MAERNSSPTEERQLNYKCRVCGSVLPTTYREVIIDGTFHKVPQRGKCPNIENHPPKKGTLEKGRDILARETKRWFETHQRPPWKVLASKWWTYTNKKYLLRRWAAELGIEIQYEEHMPRGGGGLRFVPFPDDVKIEDVVPGSHLKPTTHTVPTHGIPKLADGKRERKRKRYQ